MVNGDMHRHSPFGCHVAVGYVAPEIHMKKVMGGKGRHSQWWVFHDCGVCAVDLCYG
jgi:hypothetical protein